MKSQCAWLYFFLFKASEKLKINSFEVLLLYKETQPFQGLIAGLSVQMVKFPSFIFIFPVNKFIYGHDPNSQLSQEMQLQHERWAPAENATL